MNMAKKDSCHDYILLKGVFRQQDIPTCMEEFMERVLVGGDNMHITRIQNGDGKKNGTGTRNMVSKGNYMNNYIYFANS